jgi:DNA mismatch repair protein MutL
MNIKPLSDAVIAQIAAGEVVDRPASVVKELIENSIDAGATVIVVEVEAAGRRLIRVSDDGTGILPEEVVLAVQRHTTSKLQQPDDLLRLSTLGFRGEALAAVAAVSRTSIVTRHRSHSHGVELKLEAGRITAQRDVGHPAGTVVTVENLFFNTPARFKFLKSEASERRAVLSLVHDYAIAYPHIRFVLINEGKESFRSSGHGRLDEVALKVFGLEIFRQMIPIYGEEALNDQDTIKVHGFVSLPALYRHDRSRLVLFVNGRAVHDQNILFAIIQAYHLLMERGRYPYAVILLNVPPHFVDVNVHPTKAEVRFEDVNLVFFAVQRTVRDALIRHTQLQGVPAPPMTASTPVTNLPSTPMMPIEHDTAQTSTVRSFETPESDFDYIPTDNDVPQRPRTLPPLRVIGQLADAYIVAEGPAGMYLIDQFAASERVRYQQIQDLLRQGALPAQQVAVPFTIDIKAQLSRTLETHLVMLNQFGFHLELFGASTWRLSAAPQGVTPQQVPELINQFLLALESHQDPEAALTLLLAQASAYKTGQRLERELMEGLVRLLERCPSPLVSPSGRATLIHLSRDQLSREFSRR